MQVIFPVTYPQGRAGGPRICTETGYNSAMEFTSVVYSKQRRLEDTMENAGGHARAALRRAKQESQAPLCARSD